MKSTLILIDFDHTLFNTTRFKKELKEGRKRFNYRKFLYPDSKKFISYATKYGTPTLFSEGDVNFQKNKIIKTGMKDFFGVNIKIYPSSLEIGKMDKINKLAANYQKVILIDDKPEIVSKALALDYKVIRVKRGKYREIKTAIHPTFEVENLKEIIRQDLLSDI